MTIRKYIAPIVATGTLLAFASEAGAQTATEEKIQQLENKIQTVQGRIDSTGIDSMSAQGKQVLGDIQGWTADKDSLIKVAKGEEDLRRRAETKDTVRTSPSIIADAYFGQNGTRGARVGVNFGPVSVLANILSGSDRVVSESNMPLKNGRYAEGSERETGVGGYGVDFEFALGRRFFGGVGVQRVRYSREVEEAIYSKDKKLLDSAKNSIAASGTSGEFYGGANIPLGENASLRTLAGYGKRGGYGGLGLKFNLQRTKK
ncbi:MAG: hypothetical protein KKB79_03520 [Nanoarchaeota archaeon]|nr:hypothetical protein [Nanoarchaeota archaeon]